MSGGNEPKHFQKSKAMSVTVGNPDDESEEEELDIRERFQAMNRLEDDLQPTFVHDYDVMVPSNSAAPPPSHHLLSDAVKDVFANEFGHLKATDFEEVHEAKPAKIVKGYLFGSVLGEGAYSKVKEVLDTRTLVRRSIKIIKDKRLRKIPNGEKNVQHEIHILNQIQHDNVIRLFETFRVEEKEKLYLVMELCTCSLQQLLDQTEEKKLSEFQCHGYFVQLIDGVDYLHLKGIIHKDIKPGNILISLEGCLKICDMGVAELLQVDDPLSNDWCTLSQGTPKFQPPEVVSGTVKKFRGRPVDIWACGVTLFNMLSSHYPFNGDGLMKLYENITNCPIEWPTDVQACSDLLALLKGILTKDTELRWNSVTIRASPWFQRSFEVIACQMVHMEQHPHPSHHLEEESPEQAPQRWSMGDGDLFAQEVAPAPQAPATQTEPAARNRTLLNRILWCPWRRRRNS